MLFKRSLKYRAVALSFFPVVVILVFLGIMLFFVVEKLSMNAVITRDAEIARITALRLSENMLPRIQSLEGLADVAAKAGMDAKSLRNLINISRNEHDIFDADIHFLKTDGAEISLHQSDTIECYSDMDFQKSFTKVKETFRSTFSNVYIHPSTGEKLVFIIVPVIDKENNFTGAVAGGITLEHPRMDLFYQNIFDLKAGIGGYSCLVDGNGIVIHHREPRLLGTNLSHLLPVQYVMKQNTGGVSLKDEVGDTIIAGYSPVPGSSWGIVTMENWDHIAGELHKYRNSVFWLIPLLVVITGFLLSLGIGRALASLKDFYEGVHQISLGNFDTKIPVKTEDEIGLVATQFNVMVEKLKSSNEEIRESSTNLANQTELLNNILNNIPFNVFWKDGESVYLGCNRAFAEVTGLGTPENIIGKTDYDLPWKKEEADFYRQCDKQVVDTGIPMADIEEPLTQADGQKKIIITSKVPLKNRDGSVFGTLGIYYDITERKQLEETVKQTQKMEAIGTLAGGIAHDFNNILSAIIGYAELSHDDISQDSHIYEYIEQILNSATRAKDLVKQILTFSRKSQEERKPILIHPIVKEVAKLIRSTIPTTIEIRQHIDETTGMVDADPTQMHQIVMNLCTNAAHAMPETEGVLDIELSSVVITQESKTNYHDVAPGPFLELKISDTGTGIDSKIIHRIFEPFFTTKIKEKGTGMGLAVVHGIVKDHGGDISIDSQLGKGTTFTILLPQVVAEPDNAEDPMSEVPTGHEHILFVDDEKTLLGLGKRMLESLGYTVTAQNSSLEAFETFQQSPDTFDMVITDQTMPHMTGYNLAKRILEIKPDAHTILCTGYSDSVTPEKVEAAGIKALIYKPISKKEIAQKIRGVLDQKKI